MTKTKNKKIRLKLRQMAEKLLKSRIFLQNFLCLMGLLTALLLVFALVIFAQSRRILQKEFTAASNFQLQETAQAIDNHLKDMRYIAATLDTNNMIQALFAYEQPESIYDGYYSKVQEILKAYANGFPSIDSIYLYSQYSDTILTATEHTTSGYFSDNSWIDQLDKEEGFLYYFRAKNDAYPYVLSVLKKLNVNGYHAAIMINLSLEKLSYLSQINTDPYSQIYLISDEEQILFRYRQRELSEPLSTIPELSNFQPDTNENTLLIRNQNDAYTYSQIRSADYPWSYVMVTHLQEYTSRLSGFTALFAALFFSLFGALFLLSFLLCLRSWKPIRGLLKLIEDPQQTLSAELYSDKEIAYLANQITSYIQKNQALSDELSARLNLLNQTRLLALQSQINPHFLFNTLNMIHIQESEALGYDHKIPRLTLDLSRLLRYAIESTDLVSLETELSFTKMYLNILKERYGNRLKVVYDIQKETLRSQVPKLFIQPIIENAVFHGLSESTGEDSRLTLSCCRQEDSCIVAVRDNGTGMSAATLAKLRRILTEGISIEKGGLDSAESGVSGSTSSASGKSTSIGMKNVVTRMQLLYGDAFSIQIDSKEGEGSCFLLRFPCK